MVAAVRTEYTAARTHDIGRLAVSVLLSSARAVVEPECRITGGALAVSGMRKN